MAKIEAKQVVVDEIKSKLEKAEGVVLVSSRGLTVTQDTEMRKALREAGVDYKVYKNTMVNFAIQGTVFEALAPHLEGPTAVAISYDDATASARELEKFVSQYEPLTFKAGVVAGEYYDENNIQKIAKIPSKNELLSRLLGSFKSPMSSFARVINEIAKKGTAPSQESAEATTEAAETAETPAE
jgi:large subunit ribosomal protein L10